MRIKNLIIFFLAISAFSARSFAQLSEGGTPPSFDDKSIFPDLKIIDLSKPDMTQIRWEDSLGSRSGMPYKNGTSIYVDFSPENSGTWETLDNGDKIWRLKIRAIDALALGVYYDVFHLPLGTKLFLYNENKKQILGAYNSKNNHESHTFVNEMVQGETVTLEYYQPVYVTDKPSIHINEIAYFYRGVGLLNRYKDFRESESCEVNINCSEGTNWQTQKKGVVRIQIKMGSNYYLCTGTMINNTSNNCTPYILTADHCTQDGNNVHATASDMNLWVFYFDYESSGCTTPTTEPTPWSLTGCTVKAYGGDGGNTGSDFFIGQLNNSIPSSRTVYFNGWDRNNTAASSGVCIHHPAGDIKKISTYTSAPTSTSYGGTVQNTHWLVYWATTTNGHGVTEGGSSGSPLFNSAGKVVGTLTGGGSACVVNGAGAGTGPDQPDGYGKFSYHWESNGTTNAAKLKPWLDPTSTGVTTLSGCNCGNTSTVNADFAASATNITPGTSITYTNLSSGSPTTYSWSFPGGTPTTSALPTPPSIRYNTAGTYNVSLTVSKSGATPDTETKTGYIVVGTVVTTCDTTSNVGGTENLTAYGFSGGNWGTWTGHNQYGDKEFADKFTITGQKQVKGIFYAPGSSYNGTASSKVTFKVYQGGTLPGSTLGTKDVLLSSITAGTWNYVQFNSPITVNTSFYLGYQIYYVSPADTFYLYCAETRASQVNTGFAMNTSGTWEPFSQYTLYTSLGLAGVLCPVVGIDDNEANNDNLLIFPNPSTGVFALAFTDKQVNNADIHVYNMLGEQVYNATLNNLDNSTVQLDLTGLEKGLYVVNVISSNKKYVKKISLF